MPGYSLADDSIELFINKLNCLEGITITRYGDIEELKQQDYHGKRVYLRISDSFDNVVISKLDLGVHNKLDIEQDEYCFAASARHGGVNWINKKEYMF